MPARPLACIVGEPTGMALALKHKGKKWLRCTVHGKPGHSSSPLKGVNAIDFAAEIIVYLKEIAARLRTVGPFDAELDPPCTTLHTGVIEGGTAYNIIPSECCFDFEIRHLPAEEPSRLLEEIEQFALSNIVPRMQAIDQHTGVTFDLVSEYPGLHTRNDEPVVRLVERALGQTERIRIGYSTEAGLFKTGGTPTVVCGPGHVAQAHKADEFVAVEQLDRCARFIQALIHEAA
jgi:acetylornithine deacetylase